MITVNDLLHCTSQVVPKKDLIKKLAKQEPLVVKLGMDPTAPDLHLGHAVVLSKLRQFQDAGHQAVLIIGDFTALIGDPTGKSKTRPPLSKEEILINQQTYIAQAGRILDLSTLKIVYNSDWLAKLSFADIVQLCAKTTLARIIEREDFKKRLKEQSAIGFHELLYPLMQAYDSVILKADVELGGTDQTFNLLMGRFLQEAHGQAAQVIMTMPILEGLDGVLKMSKSLGNTVALNQSASFAFGQLVSISDTLMWNYARLLTYFDEAWIKEQSEAVVSGKVHPFSIKKQIAQAIISRFWSFDEAQQAYAEFEAVFQKGDLTNAPEIQLSYQSGELVWIATLLRALKMVESSSQAKRLIESGAVLIDGQKITDFHYKVAIHDGMIVKAGKHMIGKVCLLKN